MNRLPNARQAHIAREKVTAYLLSENHTTGQSKAQFFSRFGFRVEEWSDFADALRSHCIQNEVVETEETPYGVKYVVDGILETPDGRNPNVRTVWQVDNESAYPRIITARPIGRR